MTARVSSRIHIEPGPRGEDIVLLIRRPLEREHKTQFKDWVPWEL